jgi:predicted RNA-binding Zn ribbon-like protein
VPVPRIPTSDTPLTQPLAIELVNTEEMLDGVRTDLIATRAAAKAWLEAVGHAGAPADRGARAALAEARSAIRAVIDAPGARRARRQLNAVLARGRRIELLAVAGPESRLDVDEPRWRVPWLAAQSLLELLSTDPRRIRRCANHECILYFFDTSRGGGRRWCSMSGCGNRLKSRRHYERQRMRRPGG